MSKCFEAVVQTILILAVGILVVGTLILSGRSSEAGGWKSDSFDDRDPVEEFDLLNRDALARLGLRFEFAAGSLSDTEPPTLVSFDFNPKVVDTSESGQTITFTARITDTLSGMDYSSVRFRSASGRQQVNVSFWESNRISGDERDGTYVYYATLPQYSEAGVWTLDTFELRDGVGNFRNLDRYAVAQLGFPVEFAVESVEPAFCPDFDEDGKVTVRDIMEVAAAWGSCPAGP